MAIAIIPLVEPPTVRELNHELHSIVGWESFALQLRGIQDTDIGVIKRDNPGNTVSQKIALYSKWLSVCPNPSWADVIKALENESVGENALAAVLKGRKVRSIQQAQLPPVTARHRLSINQKVFSELKSLRDKFCELEILMEDNIKEADEAMLQEYIQVMRTLSRDYGLKLEGVETADDFVTAIRPHYSLLDCHLLVDFIEKLIVTLAKKATHYQTEVDSFMRRTASLNVVVSALREIGEGSLADELESNGRIKLKGLERDQSRLPPNKEPHLSIESQLEALSSEFEGLMKEVKDKVLLVENMAVLQEYCTFIGSLSRDYRLQPDRIKGADDLLICIEPHCNFLDCYLVVSFVQEFLSDLILKFCVYQSKVQAFLRKTTLHDSKNIRSALLKFGVKNFPVNGTTVVVTLHNAWSDEHLYEAKELVRTILLLKPADKLSLIDVSPSLAITFEVLRRADFLVKISQKRTEFSTFAGVIKLEIEGKCVVEHNVERSSTLEDFRKNSKNMEVSAFFWKYIFPKRSAAKSSKDEKMVLTANFFVESVLDFADGLLNVFDTLQSKNTFDRVYGPEIYHFVTNGLEFLNKVFVVPYWPSSITSEEITSLVEELKEMHQIFRVDCGESRETTEQQDNEFANKVKSFFWGVPDQRLTVQIGLFKKSAEHVSKLVLCKPKFECLPSHDKESELRRKRVEILERLNEFEDKLIKKFL